jgi:multisubunit Na+/H+ antiporter MnhB subunit
MDQIRVASIVSLLAGAWLAASPFVLGYAEVDAAKVVSLGGGALYVLLSLAQLYKPNVDGPAWAMLVIAFTMILAPTIFGYYPLQAPLQSQLPMALLVMVMAVWAIFASPRSWRRRHYTFASSEPDQKIRPPQ